jgi:hypothetical protein
MSFDPWNRVLKIWESIWDSNSYNGSSLRSVKVHSLTLFPLPGTCDVTPRSPSWPTTLQPLTSIVRPRLGLWHTPMMYWHFPKKIGCCFTNLDVDLVIPLHLPNFIGCCFTNLDVDLIMCLHLPNFVGCYPTNLDVDLVMPLNLPP